MKYNELKQTILEHFQKYPHTGLSYNEIVNTFQLPKAEKALLSGILSGLMDEGILTKDRKKYHLKQKPKVQHLSPTPNPKLLQGIFDATPLSRGLSYAFIRTPERDYYIDAEDTLNAFHNDVVAFEVKYRKGHQDYAVIRKIIQRSSDQLAGELIIKKGVNNFICSNPKIFRWFYVSDPAGGKNGDKVILKVTDWGNPQMGKMPVGKVIEVLGKSGEPEVELLAVIRQYNLPLEFPEDVIAEANQLSKDIKPEDYRNRRDLRNLYSFTIDPITAKDFDDAIAIEKTDKGWCLYVHIADVAHYLTVEGAIFQEASKRGNSFYFPKRVIPMLPERLSNLICSLRPEEEKLCLTVQTEFDRKGQIFSQQIYESVICSKARLNYDEVDKLFANQEADLPEELKQNLLEARALSRLLTEKRMSAGYIFFDLPEIEYEYDENGFLKHLTLAEETESHKIIENFMLVANEYVATRLSQTAPATIYRVHSDPDFNKLERLIELLSYYGVKWVMYENLNKSLQYLLNSFPNEAYHKVFDRILLRSMKKAGYSTEHIHHFALAMETYTHFTSPIRRLCDLIIHYLCKTYLCNSNSQKFAPSQLKHYADVASEQEIQADQSERDIERVYSRTMMQEHEGEIYNGMIISVNSRGLIVQLEEIPVTGVIEEINLGEGYWEYLEREMRYINRRTHQFYQLMDTLFVTISYVEDDIYLLPITKSLRHNVSKAKISWSSQKSGRTTSPSSQKSGRTTSQSSQKPGRTTSPSSQKSGRTTSSSSKNHGRTTSQSSKSSPSSTSRGSK